MVEVLVEELGQGQEGALPRLLRWAKESGDEWGRVLVEVMEEDRLFLLEI